MIKEIYCQVCQRLVKSVKDEKYSVEYITCANCDDNNMRIKISQAMNLSREYGLDKILIFGINKEEQTVVTFGESVEDSIEAAKLGNWFKKQIGWPEILCNGRSIRDKN